ncbi:helix-turn-helix domain-containing protein [Rhodococcus oxybenzonivorans]|uniref:helix-turn-helix domain-containing protein n=1 Tax=Rhodococcus oxybenzonivorans TaxID=1990687 RepID=UPI003AAB7215
MQWNKTRWRCQKEYCTRGSFTEAIEQIPARARTTGRLRTQIGTAIGDAARSVSEVATAHGVSWPTARGPTPVRVLGIDDPPRGKPRWDYCTKPAGECGSIRGTPASSTCPVTRVYWGRRRGAPPRP